VYLLAPGRPFPLILSSIWLDNAQAGRLGGVRWLPYEFTPLYGGAPALFTGLDPPVGGGLLEQIGGRARGKRQWTPLGW
jgi:hypothetical protein